MFRSVVCFDFSKMYPNKIVTVDWDTLERDIAHLNDRDKEAIRIIALNNAIGCSENRHVIFRGTKRGR